MKGSDFGRRCVVVEIIDSCEMTCGGAGGKHKKGEEQNPKQPQSLHGEQGKRCHLQTPTRLPAEFTRMQSPYVFPLTIVPPVCAKL